jgi:hypothetical protein
MNIKSLFRAVILAGVLAPGCARLAIEGGDKPIQIVMDVNVRVAHELNDFFAFEDKHSAPASNPAPTTSIAAKQLEQQP